MIMVVIMQKATASDILGGVGNFFVVFFGGIIVGLLIGYFFANFNFNFVNRSISTHADVHSR